MKKMRKNNQKTSKKNIFPQKKQKKYQLFSIMPIINVIINANGTR